MVEKTEHLERHEVVELRVHKNAELKNSIEGIFETEEEKITAWTTVQLIKELYPEMAETLNGKLVHTQKQEIK